MDPGGQASLLKSKAFPNFKRFAKRQHASNDMEDGHQVNRFFKVMGEGFREELMLPTRFSGNLNRPIPGDAILISCRGMWSVQLGICRCHALLTLSGAGWDSFIDHHELEYRNFIWFEQTGDMVFNVTVCDHSACEKELPNPADNSRNGEPDGQAECSRKRKMNVGLSWQESHWRRVFPDLRFSEKDCFTVKIEAHHLKRAYVSIPAEFSKSQDLRQKTRVILVNGVGNAWELELATYYDPRWLGDCSERNKKLRKGWSAFLEDNKLGAGNHCIFVVNRSSYLNNPTTLVMNVKVMWVV